MAYTSNLLQQMAGLSGLLGYPRVRSKADEIVKTLRPSFSGADLAEISNAIGLFKWEDSHLCNLLETAAMRTEIESSYLFKPSARDQQPDSGSSHRKTMTPAQLSKFLHGLSLLNHCPRRWLERGLPRALRASIPEMELKELSRCIAAIGCWKDEMDLSVRRHLIYQCISPALDALEKDIPSASTPALLTLLSGLSHLGLYQQKIVEAIALKLAHPNILLKLENQDLTSLLLSLAHQKHYDKQLMDDITIEFQRRAVRGNGVKQLRLKDVVGFLWSSSKFNRKLKADVLDSLSTLSLFSIDDSFQDLVTIAYSLAIMRQHVSTLASQVAMAIVEKLSSLPIQELDSHQLPSSFARQLDQVAAVLLAAQAEGVQSPLAHLLLPEIQEMAMEHWKRRTALKSLKRPNRYLHEVAAALKRIGYDARLGSMTSDQLVAPDVLVTVPSVSQVAIEMVGKHNAAGNSPSTILGDAVLKYRLLQSRGIVVLAVNCNEWDMQEKINKTLYIEEKLTGLKS